MPPIPFYGATDAGLFALERAAMDRPGRVAAHLDALLPRDGLILDAGAGAGDHAVALASSGRRIVALEPAEGMWRQATPHPRVRWIGGEAGAIPLADASVDAAYATWAYFFPGHLDPSRGLRELHRVVRRGGPIVIVDNDGGDAFTALSKTDIATDHAWFRDRGFHHEVVETRFTFTSAEDARRLLRAYFGPDRIPDPPPTDLDFRVAVWSTMSTGPPGIRVRGMRLAEADEVGRITLAAYDASGGRLVGDYRHWLADPLARIDEVTALLVAEVDGRVVGTVTFVLPGDTEWEGTRIQHGDAGFRVLAVNPEVQGTGVGRALLQACYDLAGEHRARRLIIHSMAWMTRAHALYRAHGFRRRPDLDVRFPGGDGYVFVRDLVPDADEHFPPPGPVPDHPPWYEDAWG